jgi:hypothetical protein
LRHGAPKFIVPINHREVKAGPRGKSLLFRHGNRHSVQHRKLGLRDLS